MLVQPSRQPVEESGANAQNNASSERGKSASGEASARAQELSAKEMLAVTLRSPAPSSTLSGVLPFAALPRRRHPNFHGTPLYVAPATVTAIAKAKQGRAESDPALDHRELDGAAVRVRDGIATETRTDIVRQPPAAITMRQPRAERLPAVVEPSTPATRWQTFENLGLAPKPITRKAQRLIISTYRLIGFGILSVIVAVLLGYIGNTAFYFFNESWVTPVAISPNDEKVVALQGQLATQLNVRAQLVSDFDQSERAIRAEQAFQLQFARAIKKDVENRRKALGRVRQLASAAAATRGEIRAAGDEFSASSASKLDQDYKARLIDHDQALAGKFQLAQITSAKLSLAERQVELDQRAAELATQTRSLDAILDDKTLTAALSYDVLKIARDYETSKLALAKELDNRQRLKESIARQDQIIEGVKQSGYLRAVAGNAAVALVPYDNLGNVEKGTPLYTCRFEMLVCRRVGTVLEVLPGEVPLKHPTRDSVLRGRMIMMDMHDVQAAEREVLFAGGPPLGI